MPVQEVVEEPEDILPGNTDGTLRGPPGSVSRGDVTLAIFAEKWGFKVCMCVYRAVAQGLSLRHGGCCSTGAAAGRQPTLGADPQASNHRLPMVCWPQDATEFVDPRITISVRNRSGDLVEAVQVGLKQNWQS